MKKVTYGYKEITITPETVLKKINLAYPNLDQMFEISRGELSYMLHNKKSYQIGFYFTLTDKASGSQSSIVYYPIKDVILVFMCPQPHFAVAEADVINTKRGLMRVLELNKKYVVTFTRGYSVIK